MAEIGANENEGEPIDVDNIIEVIDESENGGTFLVKWTKSKNKTWELADEVPVKLISQYKRKQAQKQGNEKTKKSKKYKHSSQESEYQCEGQLKEETQPKKGRVEMLRNTRSKRVQNGPKVITKVTTITGSNDSNMEGKPLIEILSEKDSSANEILISSSIIAEQPFKAQRRDPVCLQEQSADNMNYSEHLNTPGSKIKQQNAEIQGQMEKLQIKDKVERKSLKRQRNQLAFEEMPDIIELVAEVSSSDQEPEEINDKCSLAQRSKQTKTKKATSKSNQKNSDDSDNAVETFMKNYEANKSSKLPQRKNMNFSTFTKEANRNVYAEDLIVLTVLEQGMSGPYKFYKVKLKNGETVLIRQKHMQLHFPRKLQQFYERIINKVTKSTMPINFAL